MATQPTGIQQRTRTKAAPSFPRERQQPEQQPQQQQQQHLAEQQQQHHSNHNFFLPPTPHPYFASNIPQLSELDAWRLQPLHSAPIHAPSRRSSRGPRTTSPARSVIDPQQRVFTWDPSSHFPNHQRQNFRRKSITSNTSSSDHRLRSPSPGTPRAVRTALRSPNTTHDKRLNNNRKMTGQSNAGGNPGCSFETALVNSRRRIPYSVGSQSLAVVPPENFLARLDEKDERCLSVDIMDLYHVGSLFYC
jgi:hypothetical protein